MSPLRRVRSCSTLVLLLLVALLALPALASADEPEEPAPAPAYVAPEVVATEPPLPETPACPAAPEGSYEGSDDAAAEARALRLSMAQMCSAVVGSLGVLATRSWWSADELSLLRKLAGDDGDFISAQLAEVMADLEQTNVLLGEKGVVVKEGSGSGSSGSVEVSNAAAISSPITESVDAGAQASQLALWFLAGVLVAAMLAYIFWKTVVRAL